MTDDESEETTEVELDSVNYGDVNDKAMEVFEHVADGVGQPVTQVIESLPRVGVDPTEVTEEQAERFLEAEENEDPEEFEEVLKDLGVPEGIRDQMVQGFRDNLQERDADADTDADGEVDEPTPSKSGSDLSRAEVQDMIRRETPDADQIAAQLEQRMGGGQQQQGGGEGMSTQQQMALEMAKNFLGPSGGGPMESTVNEAQEQMQKGMAEAFGSMAKQMSRPSIGQRIGLAIEDSLAESVAEGMEISIGGEPVDVTPPDDSDDDGGDDGGDDDGE